LTSPALLFESLLIGFNLHHIPLQCLHVSRLVIAIRLKITNRNDKMNEAIIRLEGLTKYYGALPAVKSLDLEIHAGEILGFLGPNGAGKTTCINMMCGLLRPDAGQVFLHDVPITVSNADVRSRIGLCPQEVALWGRLNCAEQLQFMGMMHGQTRSQAREASHHLLEVFELTEHRRKQARKLSGGMQRRLNVAMSLIHDPEVVFLDEPEVGLDPQSRIMVREYIRGLAGSKTIILTTHNMDEADRIAHRVAIIDHGMLIALGTPESLKRSIGEEDVLEVEILGIPSDTTDFQKSVADLGCQVESAPSDDVILVRGREVIAQLPAIVEILNRTTLSYGEIRIRQTTLEDVFIHHTGRSLRE
jgi:ABC-2 type transport system ATP-binding protein